MDETRPRLIFVLHFSEGHFFLSRNFRLQKVGGYDWLRNQYDFARTATAIDELTILDVGRTRKSTEDLAQCVRSLRELCFVPISAGGGIRTESQAELLFHSGVDKVVLNSLIVRDPRAVVEFTSRWGEQAIVASVDFTERNGRSEVMIENGFQNSGFTLMEWIDHATNIGVGDLILNSMDRDGTGQGLAIDALRDAAQQSCRPIIATGGVGHWKHFAEGFALPGVNAVATANLLNFIGDGLPEARRLLIENGLPLCQWYESSIRELKNCLPQIKPQL